MGLYKKTGSDYKGGKAVALTLDQAKQEIARLEAEAMAEAKRRADERAEYNRKHAAAEKLIPQLHKDLAEAFEADWDAAVHTAALKLAERQAKAKVGLTKETPPKRLKATDVLKSLGVSPAVLDPAFGIHGNR